MVTRMILSAILLLVVALPRVEAGEVAVEHVRLQQHASGWWRAEVKISHEDDGWEHMANWIEFSVGETGRILRRDLTEPYAQADRPGFFRAYFAPFPEGTRFIEVRGHCKVHSYGGRSLRVDLSKKQGEDFQVERLPFKKYRYQFFRGESAFMRSRLRSKVDDWLLNDPALLR